jgi:hypothetical protein
MGDELTSGEKPVPVGRANRRHQNACVEATRPPKMRAALKLREPAP